MVGIGVILGGFVPMAMLHWKTIVRLGDIAQQGLAALVSGGFVLISLSSTTYTALMVNIGIFSAAMSWTSALNGHVAVQLVGKERAGIAYGHLYALSTVGTVVSPVFSGKQPFRSGLLVHEFWSLVKLSTSFLPIHASPMAT